MRNPDESRARIECSIDLGDEMSTMSTRQTVPDVNDTRSAKKADLSVLLQCRFNPFATYTRRIYPALEINRYT